jgi:outer membrane protein TolC
MKRILIIVLTTVCTSQILLAAYTLSQSEVVNTVLRENPLIKAARARWEATKKRIPQARAWDDPLVGADVQRLGTTRFTTFSDVEYMIAQSVPVSGKNLSRGRVASAEAEAAFEELRRAELDALSRARVAWFALANAYAQLDITHENQGLLAQFAEISRVKYEAGLQNQSDVLLAQTDLAKLSETEANLQREIAIRESDLNVLMDRPATAALGRPPALVFKALELPPQTIETLSLASRPEVLRAGKMVDASQARLQLAHREWIPDPQILVRARQFRESSSAIQEYDTGVLFSVPWVNFRKYSAGVAEAQNSVEQARRELEGARVEVLGLVRSQLKRIDTAARNYDLFQNKIVPLAQQAIGATRAGYEADKSSFLDLITARRNLFDAQSAALNNLAEHQTAIAELRAIIGVDPAAPLSGAHTDIIKDYKNNH